MQNSCINCWKRMISSRYAFMHTNRSSFQLAEIKLEEEHVKEPNTHFGFQTVTESEKTKRVYEVFETVAQKYDLMNDVMTFGVHRVWKDIMIDELAPTDGIKLLDMAGGTGDIAFRFLNYGRNEGLRDFHVTVCDINSSMLQVGRERAKNLYRDDKNSILTEGRHIDWQEADAERLPFETGTFDAYTIAFGIRNVTHIDRALAEAFRVLRPGGRFLCLELSHIHGPEYVKKLYDDISFQVVPVLGQIFAGQWKPYQYLVESIRKFPTQENFESMIKEAGFRATSYRNLSMGVVALHSGFKMTTNEKSDTVNK